MNSAEPAVGHQHDDVPVAAFTDDRRDDIVDLGNVPGMAALARQVVHQLLCRKPHVQLPQQLWIKWKRPKRTHAQSGCITNKIVVLVTSFFFHFLLKCFLAIPIFGPRLFQIDSANHQCELLLTQAHFALRVTHHRPAETPFLQSFRTHP